MSYKRENWLRAHGWDVEDTSVQSNSGSETCRHYICKCLVVHYLRQKGLTVTTEATHGDKGEVDVLCHGPEDGAPYAVECETSPTQEVIDDKIERYVTNSPLREVFVICVNDMPSEIMPAYKWIASQLP